MTESFPTRELLWPFPCIKTYAPSATLFVKRTTKPENTTSPRFLAQARCFHGLSTQRPVGTKDGAAGISSSTADVAGGSLIAGGGATTGAAG
jgi:hypothetical protein